ncbi:DUF354 domain-containing protein [Desulfobotulus sp. H1]|uniref:DUF354 domain-containing protein n=1 Tax=Desulfobotulus pelophilus TaxID=2823377 RepID=A0ABT3NC79_9BACT|nr:DUF354 domain-containing protein [Desulfobotulus pelophilus]MCW7755064.1 DUF354 domain-containing protein [Desulfobotulus pelophilus]
MKIWFEITNSPHINLFINIMKELEKDHEVMITCRDLANTIDLLKLHELKFEIVGSHYGKSLFKKIWGFPIRVLNLISFIKRKRPDVAIGQSSFQQPIAARLMGVPVIYMNDNEHAWGNIPSFLFANKILIPEYLSMQTVKKQLAFPGKVTKYPGLKEGIYLWRLVSNRNKAKKNGRKVVFFRPEPRTAQYYHGDTSDLDAFLIKLKDIFDVVISPRDLFQKQYYEQEKFYGIYVLDKPLPIKKIIEICDVFIGAGGTMSREMAVAGIPTISVYHGAMLEVDSYLLKNKMLLHKTSLDIDFFQSFIAEYKEDKNFKLLAKGKEAEMLIIKIILNKGDV